MNVCKTGLRQFKLFYLPSPVAAGQPTPLPPRRGNHLSNTT